jgi:hypothetical protein
VKQIRRPVGVGERHANDRQLSRVEGRLTSANRPAQDERSDWLVLRGSVE